MLTPRCLPIAGLLILPLTLAPKLRQACAFSCRSARAFCRVNSWTWSWRCSNATAVTGLKVTASRVDLTSKFSEAVRTELDCDTSSDFVLRANLKSFDASGTIKLEASLSAGGTVFTDSRDILVWPFGMDELAA